MARPPITLTEDQVREVETLAALLNQDHVDDCLCIARNAYRAICNRIAEILARYIAGKAKAIDHVANGLLQKARTGDTNSVIFCSKAQARWQERTEIAHSEAVDGTGVRDRRQLLLDQIADRSRRIGGGPGVRAAIDGTAAPEPLQ